MYCKKGSMFKRLVIFYLLYLNSVIKSIVTSSLFEKEKTHKRNIKVTDLTSRRADTFLKPNIANVCEKVWEKEKRTK
jgi:hypothetical protein